MIISRSGVMMLKRVVLRIVSPSPLSFRHGCEDFVSCLSEAWLVGAFQWLNIIHFIIEVKVILRNFEK